MPTIPELTEAMQAAKIRAEAAKRRWNLYEGTAEEMAQAEAEFAVAFDRYHRARFGSVKPPAIRRLIR